MVGPARIVTLITEPSVETLVGENLTLSAVGRSLADSTAVSVYSEDVSYVSEA
jgi:hypothetical protein